MYDRPQDRVRVQTRDAEQGFITSPKPGGRVDLGRIWTGVLQALTSMSDEDRPAAVQMIGDSLSAYAESSGCDLNWKTDAAGHTLVGDKQMSDGARRASAMADTIGGINRRNAEYWKPQS
jgi:hypothetical protein